MLEKKRARVEYTKLGKDSAIVIKEMILRKIKIDENKVQCPFLFIAAKKDIGCPPEIVMQMAGKYNADYQEFDCCHHFFLNKNWKDVADGINKFISIHVC